MKKKFNNRFICLMLAALVLVGTLTAGKAMAYFTAYDTNEGGVEVDLGFTTTVPEEEVENEQKQIKITNTGDYDAYVRIKVLVGDKHKDGIVVSEPGGEGKWTPGADGYYYYSDILAPGESTGQINVNFTFPTENPDDFNVIIIQESTPVLYDEDGSPYADWDAKAEISQSVG